MEWLRFELPTKQGRSLSPLVPPNIEPVLANKAVLENASVTLECLASGVPPPGKTPPGGGRPHPRPHLVRLAGARHRSGCGDRMAPAGPSPCSSHFPLFLLNSCSSSAHYTAQSEGLAGPPVSLFSPPDISWFKGRQPVSAREGVTVSADGRVLLIERARLSDAGSYRCVASNVAGRTELQYGLRVNGELPWD